MEISSSFDFRSPGTRNPRRTRWRLLSMISPPLLALQRIFSSRVVSVEGPSQAARDSKKLGKEVLTTIP